MLAIMSVAVMMWINNERRGGKKPAHTSENCITFCSINKCKGKANKIEEEKMSFRMKISEYRMKCKAIKRGKV